MWNLELIIAMIYLETILLQYHTTYNSILPYSYIIFYINSLLITSFFNTFVNLGNNPICSSRIFFTRYIICSSHSVLSFLIYRIILIILPAWSDFFFFWKKISLIFSIPYSNSPWLWWDLFWCNCFMALFHLVKLWKLMFI